MIQTLTAPENLKECFESPYVTLWMEGNILCCRYASDLDMTLEVAKFCVEGRIFFSKGQNSVMLVDMRGIKSMTKEARKYMASIGATLVTAAALITGSTINRTIGNVFLAIDKPPVPVRLFTEEDKAKLWLESYL